MMIACCIVLLLRGIIFEKMSARGVLRWNTVFTYIKDNESRQHGAEGSRRWAQRTGVDWRLWQWSFLTSCGVDDSWQVQCVNPWVTTFGACATHKGLLNRCFDFGWCA
jgi:hypothetical protein